MPRILASPQKMTFEEYLEFEKRADMRHEFVDGFVFAMAGATDTHNHITGSIFARAYLAALNTQCFVYKENMKLRTPDGTGYYPDVFAVCDPNDTDNTVKTRACFIVEVLSDSTQDLNRGEKWIRYQQIKELQSYILVFQQQKRLEIYKRQSDSSWRYEVMENEGVLELPCLNLAITLAEIYERVDFSAKI